MRTYVVREDNSNQTGFYATGPAENETQAVFNYLVSIEKVDPGDIFAKTIIEQARDADEDLPSLYKFWEWELFLEVILLEEMKDI